MEQEVPAISTGDWITMAIGAATLGVAVVATYLGWLALRPQTAIYIAWCKVILTESHGTLACIWKAAISPIGGGFVVLESRCKISISGNSIELEAAGDTAGHEGKSYPDQRMLQFLFHEKAASPVRSLPSSVTVDTWLRLIDGSKKHKRFSDVPIIGLASDTEEPQFLPEQ